MNKEESANSIRKNTNEVHEVNCFRNGVNFFRTLVNLFRKVVLRKSLFVVWELCRSSFGVLSVFSRLSVGKIGEGIREVKETAILTKRTFCIWNFFDSSLVLISPFGSNDFSFLGSSLVFYKEEIGKVQRNGILRIVPISVEARE